MLGGRYRVERLIGEGGMGAVYEAVQLDLGRRVALKVLLGAAPADGAFRRFRQEAEAAARLGHAHIAQVTDFQHVPGEPPFLVMELLAGRSLRDVLVAEGRLEWRRSARIGMQLLDALGAAHAARVIHRDVKPENVFVVESRAVQDMIKVLDFGIAKLAEPATPSGPLTAAGAAIGTPAYMAPEQARGDDVDARADLYAVAVVLFEAAAGRRPIEVDPTMRLAAAIGAPPARLEDFVRDVEPRFAAAIARALAKDPRDRFASAAEMASAIATA
ncbi:MAG TPA: serine/threonine-protein kinase, partial [Labilithrix sp.]